MRTTLTLDDDLGEELREWARILRLPFRQVVNDAIRRGSAPEGPRPAQQAYQVRPFDARFVAGIDPYRLNQLLGDEAVDQFVEGHGE